MNKIRWGIIGCGDVTEVKSGPAFNLIEDSELIAVMRRDATKAEDYAKRHNVPKWYSDADKLINDKDVNAIYIATPPSSHAEYTIKAAEAGKPVFVEKPMAANYSDCVKMVDVCKQNNVPLFVAYYRRELPYFKKIQDLISANEIGDVRLVNIKLFSSIKVEDSKKENLPWRVTPEISGGGYFYDLASHQFDYLDNLFGSIKFAKGLSGNHAKLYPAEDYVTAVYEFESGIAGTGSWCFTTAPFNNYERTEIIGSKGRIEFSFFSQQSITLENQNGIKHINEEFPKHIQLPLITTVVEDLLNRGKCISTGESASKTNWVMDKILGKIS